MEQERGHNRNKRRHGQSKKSRSKSQTAHAQVVSGFWQTSCCGDNHKIDLVKELVKLLLIGAKMATLCIFLETVYINSFEVSKVTYIPPPTGPYSVLGA